MGTQTGDFEPTRAKIGTLIKRPAFDLKHLRKRLSRLLQCCRGVETFISMGVAGDGLLYEGWLQGLDASKLLIALLPVWILGALIGMLVRAYLSCRCLPMTCKIVARRLTACLVRQLTHAYSLLQLPRPRWLETSTRFGAYWLSSPSGVLLRRFTLAVHGFVIASQAGPTIRLNRNLPPLGDIEAIKCLNVCREVWRHCTIPGTFHAIAAAVWGVLQGKGFDLQLPDVPPHVNALIKDAKAATIESTVEAASLPAADW